MNSPVGNYNVVLTGPSGSGKSTVGRLLAEVYQRKFLDMDGEIEKRVGCSISRYFATEGEVAFRNLETELCIEISQQHHLVVATGGGVLLRQQNVDALTTSGILVNLNSSLATLVGRLAAHRDRPLLHQPENDLEQRLKDILAKRKAIYDAVEIQICTDELRPEEVVTQIQKRLAKTGDVE